MDLADQMGVEPEIEALRKKIMPGLIPFDDFAKAIGKHPKTLAKLGPPLVYVGRTPYVPEEPGRAWVLNGCTPVEPDKSRRGRKVAA
jgi:hypothetical protein